MDDIGSIHNPSTKAVNSRGEDRWISLSINVNLLFIERIHEVTSS